MTAGSGAKILLAYSDIRHAAGGAADGQVHRPLAGAQAGWAQSVAEREPGVASVSAPVRDGRGQVIAAVSVSGPIDRMGQARRAMGGRPVGGRGCADSPTLTRAHLVERQGERAS